MTLLDLAILSSLGIKTAVMFIYAYLYHRYRERFLGIWTAAWAVIMVKTAMDPFTFTLLKHPPILMFYEIVAMLCVLLLAWGTANFVGKRLSPFWINTTVLLILFTGTGLWLDWPLNLLIFANLLFYTLIYVHTGLILLKTGEAYGISKKLTAYAFVIVGVHQLTWPLLRPDTAIAHWGYMLDSFLRLGIGLGFLLTYFEKTRYDLANKEEQFRLLAENARDIIFRFRLEPSPHIDYISPAAAAITGYRPEEFHADPKLIINLVHPEDRHLIRKDGKLALHETPLLFRMLTREQKLVWVELHFTLLRSRDGEITAVEGIVRDVTARKELEQELFRLDRLNIVGQMAANIGHEIRNPLTTVRGYLQVLARKPELMRYGDNFRLLLDELDRANALITEYLSLSKNRLTDQQPRNLNAIVESLFPLIVADAVSSNQIVTLELGAVPELPLDEKEIRQLLLNLVRNGLEAMEPGKTMTITTTATQEAVILSVQDQGRQIPADVLEKLGMPFFTTKEKGTGLGLAICYSIANRHRAKIHVDTGPQGTTFSVSFSLKN
jgi:PAS domain S-box-containing protein